MSDKSAFTNPKQGKFLPILISLTLASGLLLSGSTSGIAFSNPTPAPPQPAQWPTSKVEPLINAQRVKTSPRNNPKLDSSLNQLLEANRQMGFAQAQDFAASRRMVLDGDRVQVIVETSLGSIEELKAAIADLGGEYQSHYEGLLQALVPIAALASLAERTDVIVVRDPRRFVPAESMQAVSTTSQGVAASNASAWHTAGIDGSGVKVAVIDGGFTYYSDFLGTELPASVTTYDWTGTGMAGTYHGTACAEIVYDMAPGATLYLHKINTVVQFGNAVNQAIADGVDVISMSGGWTLGGPGDGTGSLASIVSNARSNGIFFAEAAGNEAEVSWSGYYTDHPYAPDSHMWPHGGNVNCFGPGSPDETCYSIPAGYQIEVALHWDDWSIVDQDYELELYRWTGSEWQLVAYSYNAQYEYYPTPEEYILFTTSAANSAYGVLVYRYYADRNACFSIDAHTATHLDEWVTQRSLFHPADSSSTITVGAVDVSSYAQEAYSSQGPTFGSGGACSGGSTKPDIAAYANVSTVLYSGGGFDGTSAATPHVAGAAALVKQAYPSFSVSQLQSFLETKAINLGVVGKDNIFGAGRLYLGTITRLYLPLVMR